MRLRASGDEEFIMCRAGGKVIYKLRSGATKDGKLRVIEADLLFDTGAYIESQMIVTTLTSKYLGALYPIEASRYRGRLAHTNHLPYYFHHGGGLAQFQFALGQHMDELAQELGMDSVEFSLLNGVEEGYTTDRTERPPITVAVSKNALKKPQIWPVGKISTENCPSTKV